ncbi:unnamed protein product [Arctogadus glacialis]
MLDKLHKLAAEVDSRSLLLCANMLISSVTVHHEPLPVTPPPRLPRLKTPVPHTLFRSTHSVVEHTHTHTSSLNHPVTSIKQTHTVVVVVLRHTHTHTHTHSPEGAKGMPSRKCLLNVKAECTNLNKYRVAAHQKIRGGFKSSINHM